MGEIKAGDEKAIFTLIRSINLLVRGLATPENIEISLFPKADKALYVRLQNRIIAPVAFVHSAREPATKLNRMLAEVVTAHEYGHAIWEANVGSLFPPPDPSNSAWNRARMAYYELFGDLIAVFHTKNLSCIAEAQRYIGKTNEALRDFGSPVGLTKPGKDPIDLLNPARAFLGTVINPDRPEQIEVISGLIRDELDSLSKVDASNVSAAELNRRFIARVNKGVGVLINQASKRPKLTK